MILKNLVASNLYSFEKASISFGKYNVITGINGVGKSNILRILNLPIRQISNGFYTSIFDSQKLDKDKCSWMILYLELSERESEIVSRNLFRKSDNRRWDVQLIILWEGSRNRQQKIKFALIIQNKLIIWNENQNDRMTFVKEQKVDDGIALFSYLETLRRVNDNEINQVSNEKGFEMRNILQNTNIHDLLFDNPSRIDDFFYFQGQPISIPFVVEGRVGIDENMLNSSELMFEYTNVDLWFLMAKILSINFTFVNEFRPSLNDLENQLNDIKKGSWILAITKLQNDFTSVFPEYTFEIDPKSKNGQPNVIIIKLKNGKPIADQGFKLEDSASGYFEVLYMLMILQKDNEGIIFLDEPSLHLHPIKQIDFWKFLTKKNTNQIVAITHSPYLINLNLFKNNNRLLNVQMIEGKSKICSSVDLPYDSIKLKEYNFKPEMFFSKCTIFVEGASDESAISAISERLGGIFDKYSIQIINVGGKDILEAYVDLIHVYSIPHIALTDYDYLCDNNKGKPKERAITEDFIILPQRLEEVLHIFDVDVKIIKDFDMNNPCSTKDQDQPDSVHANDAYKIIYRAMSNDIDQVRLSKLGEVVNRALEKAGVNNLEWKVQLNVM